MNEARQQIFFDCQINSILLTTFSLRISVAISSLNFKNESGLP